MVLESMHANGLWRRRCRARYRGTGRLPPWPGLGAAAVLLFSLTSVTPPAAADDAAAPSNSNTARAAGRTLAAAGTPGTHTAAWGVLGAAVAVGLCSSASFFGARRVRRMVRSAADVVAVWLGQARLGRPPGGELHRRRHVRWPWGRTVLVALSSGRLQVQAADVGAGGAGLWMPHKLEIGTALRISDVHQDAWVAARVCWVDQPDERGLYRTGVQFEHAESAAGDDSASPDGRLPPQ